jgi:phenylpyruvate tautomerase PptA (4-oxalocrotonate tautomerase family)
MWEEVMPNVDVIYTSVDDRTRDLLVKVIADTLLDELECSPEAITTRIHEIPETHFAVGRELLRKDFQGAAESNSSIAQPLCEIRIGWFAGKDKETENRIAVHLTRNISTLLQIPSESVEIATSVMHRGNYFIAGQRIDVKEP